MARLYHDYCPKCDEETSWIHDDMSIASTPDRCRKCGNTAAEALKHLVRWAEECVCGSAITNSSYMTMGVRVDDLDPNELFCNPCLSRVQAQLRVDDDFDKYGFEDNWSDE